jgi:predicted RNA-binding protein Jag
MKSIMEEASSISKAIDLAWNRAGKPAQFSVKVLEEPERNLFGLTVKSAKIALFFEERRTSESHVRPLEKKRPQRPEVPQVKQQEQKQRAPEQPKQSKRQRPTWNDDLAQEAKDWVNGTLKALNLEHISYTATISGSAIKFIFESSPTGTQAKDRMLFSSFATLILATLRNRHKRQIRNLKVILLTA